MSILSALKALGKASDEAATAAVKATPPPKEAKSVMPPPSDAELEIDQLLAELDAPLKKEPIEIPIVSTDPELDELLAELDKMISPPPKSDEEVLGDLLLQKELDENFVEAPKVDPLTAVFQDLSKVGVVSEETKDLLVEPALIKTVNDPEVQEIQDQFDAGLLTVGEKSINQLDAKFFDISKIDLQESVGPHWAGVINAAHNAGIIPQFDAILGLKAIIKKAKSRPVDAEESEAFDKITDMIENLEEHMNPSGELNFSTEAIGDVGAQLSLDELHVGIDNQNSPFKLDEMINLNDTQGNVREGIAWIGDLKGREKQAIQVMTHIRGATFGSRNQDWIARKYASRGDPLTDARRIPKWPEPGVYHHMREMDVAAINFYTKRGDGAMNEWLRAGEEAQNAESDLAAAVDATQKALKNLPSWGTRRDEEGRLVEGLLYRRLGDPAIAPRYLTIAEGEKFTEEAFTSATRTPIVDNEGAQVNDEFRSLVTFVIKPKPESSRAHGIEGLSEYQNETEVLYEHSTSFQMVRKITKQDHGRTVHILFMEEL